MLCLRGSAQLPAIHHAHIIQLMKGLRVKGSATLCIVRLLYRCVNCTVKLLKVYLIKEMIGTAISSSANHKFLVPLSDPKLISRNRNCANFISKRVRSCSKCLSDNAAKAVYETLFYFLMTAIFHYFVSLFVSFHTWELREHVNPLKRRSIMRSFAFIIVVWLSVARAFAIFVSPIDCLSMDDCCSFALRKKTKGRKNYCANAVIVKH